MSEPNNQDHRRTPLSTSIKGIASFVPFAVGLGYGINQIRANEPVSILGPSSNFTQRAGVEAGRKLRKHTDIHKAERSKMATEIATELTNSDEFKKIWQDVKQQNAVLQSLKSTIDDPSIGLDPGVAATLRTQVEDLIKTVGDRSAAEQTVHSAIRSVVDSGSERARLRFAHYMNVFKRLAPQLQAPVGVPKSGVAINQLSESSLSQVSQRRLARLRTIVPKANIEFQEMRDVNGEVGQYAKISSGYGQGASWKTTLPLDPPLRSGVPIFRVGEFGNTRYRAERLYGRAGVIEQMRSEGSALGRTDLSNRGASAEIPDIGLDLLETHVQRAHGNLHFVDPHQLNEEFRSLLTTDERAAAHLLAMDPKSIGGRLGRHLAARASMAASSMKILGIEGLSRTAQDRYPVQFVGQAGFEPGVPAEAMMTRDIRGNMTSSVGLASHAPIMAMKVARLAATGQMRHFLPITAREHQITGRDTMFLERRTRPLGKSFTMGPDAGNIGWGGELTGGTNRAFLIDFRKDSNLGLEQGEAFGLRGSRIVEAVTKPILESELHGNTSSAMLNYILKESAGSPNGMANLSKRQLRKFAHYLGVGDAGEQYLRADPFMKEMALGVIETTDMDTKKLVHASGYMTKDVDAGTKFFSTLFKGLMKLVSKKGFGKALDIAGMTYAEMKETGINPQDMLIIDGSMMKKAPAYLANQMISGLGLVQHYDNDVFDHIAGKMSTGTHMNLGQHTLGQVTDAVIDELAKGGVDTRNAGRVLAGIWALGSDNSMIGYKVEQDAIKTMIHQRFTGTVHRAGKDIPRAEDVIKHMTHGFGLGADTAVPGPAPASWGEARGSSEQRFIRFMQHRLRMMGMPEGDISDFIMNTISRKEGIEDQIEATHHLANLQQSLIGNISPTHEFNKAVHHMTTQDLITHLESGKTMEELLMQHESVMLDLGGLASKEGLAIRAAAGQEFRGGTMLHLPGRGALQAMHGAGIKTSEGTEPIAPEYLRAVKQLGNDVLAMSTDVNAARSNGNGIFERFRSQMTDLYTGSLGGTVRGKISGSQFLLGATYNMNDPGIEFQGEQLQHVRSLFKQTKGQAVFLDTRAFISSLQDFMGTSGAKDELGGRLRSFFLSSELDPTNKQGAVGIASFGGRHAMVGPGHVAPEQIFREVHEVGRLGTKDNPAMRDLAFINFASTKAGREAIKNLEAKGTGRITGFRSLATLGPQHESGVAHFFDAMGNALGAMGGGGGGGMKYYPQLNVQTTWTVGGVTRSKPLQMSISHTMIGDADGDNYSTMMLNSELSKKLMHTMEDKNLQEIYMHREVRFKTLSGIFMEHIKEKMRGIDISKLSPEEQAEHVASFFSGNKVMQDVMKERALKGVGPLDVRLGMLRSAAVAYGNTDQVSDVLALLAQMEEGIAIKAKKLAEYHGIERATSAAIEHLFEHGDAGPLRAVMKNEIFSEGFFDPAGFHVQRATTQEAGEYITPYMMNMRVNAEDMIQHLLSYSRQTVEAGRLQEFETTSRQSVQLKNDATAKEAAKNLIMMGVTEASAISRGWAGDVGLLAQAVTRGTMERVGHAVSKLDRNLLGPAVIGAVGTAILGGILGTNDYSAQPLVMPGEYVSPQVSDAIAAGSLFSSEQVGPTPESMQGSGGIDMMDRTINSGVTYQGRPNSYQIRGEVQTGYGFGHAVNQLSSMMTGRGGGSVTINDQRRPITPNYVDRFTGD